MLQVIIYVLGIGIANVVPIDLLAFERKRTYDQEIGKRIVDAQTDSVDIRMGKTYFYLTQFLTRHWYFRKYLYNLNRSGHPFANRAGMTSTPQSTHFL